jgi:hypothetical protein
VVGNTPHQTKGGAARWVLIEIDVNLFFHDLTGHHGAHQRFVTQWLQEFTVTRNLTTFYVKILTILSHIRNENW